MIVLKADELLNEVAWSVLPTFSGQRVVEKRQPSVHDSALHPELLGLAG